MYFITPYSVLLPTEQLRYAAILTIMIIKAFAVIVGFPCMTILLTNSASSLKILGTLNGFATTFSAVGRAFGPAVTGATFSWGLDVGYVIPAWWFLGIIGVVGAVQAYWIYDGDGPSASFSSSSSSADGEESESDEAQIPRQDSAVVFESDDEADVETPLMSDVKGRGREYNSVRGG